MTTTQLSESIPDKLTNGLWEKWKAEGVKPRSLTWMELHRLTEHFLKICRQQNRDYREFDFYTMIDYTYHYDENRAEIENIIGGLSSKTEAEAVNKMKDYFTEEQLSEYTSQERNVIDDIEHKNESLTKKLGQITKTLKAQELQNGDMDKLKEEIEQIQREQATIISKLERIPNLTQLVTALEGSKNFKPIGEAIRPITKTLPPPEQKQKPKTNLSTWIKSKQLNPLDCFAAALILTIWLGATYEALVNIAFSGWLVIGLSLMWLLFIGVSRLVIGGILN